jgi:hypothetical protein
MPDNTALHKTYYTLRIAMGMCFIGHGAFGIITKPIWCNYFAVFGIGNDLAYKLMPLLGGLDIILGLIILIYPIRSIVIWLVVWGVVTALLRPLSGESFAEFIERAGNYGTPAAMLLLTGIHIRNFKELFSPVSLGNQPDTHTIQQVTFCLRCTVFLLLAGHGWLNLAGKSALIDQYSNLGFSDPASIAQFAGIFEICAAAVLLVRPFGTIILIVLIWKMSTEFLYPHYTLFEWIERGGSYGSLLSLYFLNRTHPVIFPRVPHFNFSNSAR